MRQSNLFRVSSILILALLSPVSFAGIITYTVDMSGPNESPTNASPGIGTGQVVVDTTANTMHVHVDFSGLVGTTTASHIHSPTVVPLTGTAGVATTTPTFFGFPLGVTAGTYDQTLDLTAASSYNPAYITAHGNTTAQAESDLLASFAAGTSYWNIHSTSFPGGEIRGFLVPEPTSLGLIGCAALFAFRRRRH